MQIEMAFQLSPFWRLFLLSLTAIPITHLLDKLISLLMKNDVPNAWIFVIGILLLSFVAAVAYLLTRGIKGQKSLKNSVSSKKTTSIGRLDPYLYVFATFAFTACLDLGFAFEVDGYVSSFVTQYLINGEPYLNSPFGALLCYNDGTVLYGLYLIMIHCITNNKSYRSVALYWVGNIVNSLLATFPGVFAGKHGLYPSTALNVPFFVFPIVVGWKFWHQRPNNVRLKPVSTIWRRIMDVGFIVFFIFATVVAVMRAFAAFGTTVWLPNYYLQKVEPYLRSQDPAPFPQAQMLVYLYYYVPVYLLSIYGLIYPESSPWLSDVSLIHAGAAANAQVCHIGTSIHSKTPAQFHPLKSFDSQIYFWAINLTLLIVPQLLVARDVFSSGMQKSVAKRNTVNGRPKKMANGSDANIDKVRTSIAKVNKKKSN